MRNKKGQKKAQITIFIILAIAIVIIIALIFVERGNIPISITPETPLSYIKNCIIGNNEEDSLKSMISELSSQGGTLAPKNYFLYEDNKIEYLCYTEEVYKKCVMQKPFLKNDIEKELSEQMKSKVDVCLENFRSSYESKGYEVSFKKPNVSVEIVPKTILISLDNLDLKITKSQTENYKIIKADFNSNIYDFIMIASAISNQEARFGDTETMVYMINYPLYKVEKKKQSDGTGVYILTDKETSEKFMFASKSLVLPSGIRGL